MCLSLKSGEITAPVARALGFRYEWQDAQDDGAMRKDRAVQAWNQGYDAGFRLLPSDRNPYKSDSWLHEAWEDGWYQGSDPDLEDMEGSRRRA